MSQRCDRLSQKMIPFQSPDQLNVSKQAEKTLIHCLFSFLECFPRVWKRVRCNLNACSLKGGGGGGNCSRAVQENERKSDPHDWQNTQQVSSLNEPDCVITRIGCNWAEGEFNTLMFHVARVTGYCHEARFHASVRFHLP